MTDFMSFDLGDVIAGTGVVGTAIGVYVALDRKVTKLETQVTGHKERMDRTDATVDARFKEQGDRLEKCLDRISEQLASINDRLAGKVDRGERH